MQAASTSVPTNIVRQTSPDQNQIASASDGPDKENDGDGDDVGATTATRGKNLNITA